MAEERVAEEEGLAVEVRGWAAGVKGLVEVARG